MGIMVLAVCTVAAAAVVIVLAINRPGVGRLVAALSLLAAALICGFLFLAGFEYPGVTSHKVVTGSLGVLFLSGAILVARRKTTQ